MSSPDQTTDTPVNTLRDGWAALAMIRETIETLGPPGALIAEEAVLAKYGPEYHHEAQAICDALAELLPSIRYGTA